MVPMFTKQLFPTIAVCLLAALLAGCRDKPTTTRTPDADVPVVETLPVEPPAEPPVVAESPVEEPPAEDPTVEPVADKPLP